ncbi:MAG: hypothetical protein WCI04_04680 [archaeon]
MIKQIDIIVYPFFLSGFELEEAAGERKFRQWLYDMRRAVTTKDKAFIVINMTSIKVSEMKNKVERMYDTFLGVFNKLQKEGLAIKSASGQPLHLAVEAVRTFAPKGFDPKIKISYYGQHAGACVQVIGGATAAHIKKELLMYYNINASTKEQSAKSIKFRAEYARKIAKNELTRQEIVNYLYAVDKKEASIFLLRKPQKVKEFLIKKHREEHQWPRKKENKTKKSKTTEYSRFEKTGYSIPFKSGRSWAHPGSAPQSTANGLARKTRKY